jgi:hypothetical protein
MSGTEIIAREIAMWHGSAITGVTRTVASDAGYGNWGHSPDRYADGRWREYIGAAEAMLARINRVDAEIAGDSK